VWVTVVGEAVVDGRAVAAAGRRGEPNQTRAPEHQTERERQTERQRQRETKREGDRENTPSIVNKQQAVRRRWNNTAKHTRRRKDADNKHTTKA
jgi:hypothetical protein